jgi:hypothetical protein
MPVSMPLAHAGHWYEWIPFLLPVVIVLAASIRAIIHQRREEREREASAKNEG